MRLVQNLGQVRRTFLYSKDELRTLTNMRLMHSFSDGEIYIIYPLPAEQKI